MSTFIVNANDTIVVSDNIVVKTSKLFEVMQPVVKEAETNCNDVTIAIIICATAVLIVLIVAVAARLWRKQSKDEAIELNKQKQQHEKDMKEREFEHNEKEDNRKKVQYFEKLAKEQEHERGKNNYQKYEEFVEKMVNLAKNSEGTINEDILIKLFETFDTFKDKFKSPKE